MADVEKAVELLRDVERMARDWRMTDLADRAREALRALGKEEGEDKWRAYLMADGSGQWIVADRANNIVAAGLSATHATRIADDHNRLPRLERAAQEVVSHQGMCNGSAYRVVAKLRAALDEGQP